MIDTDGAKVGQINGLSVMTIGEYSFGKPVRVIEKIKELGGAAPVLGFGISTPEHVRKAIEIGAEGAIAGSACVKIIEENLHGLPLMFSKLEEYVRSMKAATLRS